MKFDQVVCPPPYAIRAGDPVGHMGYYQAPKDGGYEARYQVHIECTSMDDNLETFLTNPEQVGEKNPLWLVYVPGLALYKKEVATGTFTKDTRVTTVTGILPLSQVQIETDKTTKQEYWQLRPENAYVLKGQAEPQLLSQYDLAKLGFKTETAEPVSFDYLDGKNQPTGFFRNLIDSSTRPRPMIHEPVMPWLNIIISDFWIKLIVEAIAILQWNTGKHFIIPIIVTLFRKQ